MKTFVNFRFLAALILALAVAGAAVHGLHVLQLRHHAGFLLDQARRAQEDKEYPLAIARFQQYTSLEPGDTEALADFGLLLADVGQRKQASAKLEKVLRSRPDREDVRRRLVRVEMELGRFGDAKEHLQYLLDTSPNDSSLWEQLGICLAAGAEYPAAAGAFGKAIKLDPQQLEAYARLADVLRRRLDKSQEADQWVEKLVALNPKSARAQLLAAAYLEGAAQDKEKLALEHPENTALMAEARALYKQALEHAEQALKLAPDDVDACVLAARLASTQGRHDQARAHAQRAIELDPKRAAGYSLLAHTELRTNHRKEAIACLKRGLEKASRHNDLLWALGRLQMEEGDLAQAQKTLDQLRAESQADPLADYLQAQLEFTRGHWQEAARGFEQLVGKFEQSAGKVANSPELLKEVQYRRKEVQYRRALCYQRLGNREQELAAYREAARVDPLWRPAQVGIAATLAALGKHDEALEQYRQIAKLAGAAKESSAETTRVMSDMAGLLVLKNLRLTPAERDWNEVNSLLDRLMQADPKAAGPVILRAEVLVGQDRAAEAEKVLLAARDKMPDQQELWGALLSLAGREKQWDRANQLLGEAKKKFGDRAWLRAAEGQYLLRRFGKDSASKLQELAKGAETLNAADLPRLYGELAALSWDAGDHEQGQRVCRLACAADPANRELRLLQLGMAMRAGDPAEIEQVLKGVRKSEGDGPLWHYGEAARLGLLADKGGKKLYKQALQHLATARELRPAWAAVPLLAARVHDEQGDTEAALADYLKAIELGDRGQVAIRRAFELLSGQHRYAEADQLLRRLAQEQGMFSTGLGRMASEVSAQLDNMDRALELARQVAERSKQWRDYVSLGRLLGFLGRRAQLAQQLEDCKARFAEAEKSFRHAAELAPEVPETWVALVQFLSATEQKPAAEEVLREAQRKLPADHAALALGPCQEALGNLTEAAKHYESVLAKDPKDPAAMRRLVEFRLRSGNPEEAESHLRTFVAGQSTAKAEDAVWARRTQAAILRARGGYQNLRQALALVEQNLAVARSVEDQQEQALILAGLPQRAERQEAIKILEELVQAQPAALPQARFALAQLCLAQGDWPRARKHMLALVSNQGKEPRYVATFVTLLLDHQETQEAELWLGRLEQLVPNEFPTIQLKAAAMIRRSQVDEAIRTLRACLAKPPAPGLDAGVRLGIAASFCERESWKLSKPEDKPAAAKLAAEAERLYRAHVKEHPERELLLAGFLARQGRPDEALVVAERAWPQADQASIVRAGTELLKNGAPPPADLQRLEKIVRGAVDKYRRAPLMLSLLADVYVNQERFEDAERTYQEVLSQDKTNYVAMNNLALLFALQKKELEKSLQLVQQAIELAGPLPALIDSRGLVRLAMGQPHNALADFDKAIREDPQPDRFFHRSQACWKLGEEKAAADALQEARKRGLKPQQLHPLERQEYRRLAGKAG
jgi:tetratricopeptide (TPR) repeat protein